MNVIASHIRGAAAFLALVTATICSATQPVAPTAESAIFKQNAKTYRIAIPRFIVPTGINEEGGNGRWQSQSTIILRERLADLLTQNIKELAPQVTILERRELDQAIKELRLEENALFEQNDAASRLGKLLKADYIIIGKTSYIGSRTVEDGRLAILSERHAEELAVSFTVQVLHVETGEVVDSKTFSGRERFYVVGTDSRIKRTDRDVALGRAVESGTVDAAKDIRLHFWTELSAASFKESSMIVGLPVGEKHRTTRVGVRVMVYEITGETTIEGQPVQLREPLGEATITSIQPQASLATFTNTPRKDPRKCRRMVVVRLSQKENP